MQLLALALLCWIAGACLTIGYIANVAKSTSDALDGLAVSDDRQFAKFDAVANRLDVIDRLAAQGAMGAKAAQKAIDEHLEWVAAQRKPAPKSRRGR